jgi:hypothetical protein
MSDISSTWVMLSLNVLMIVYTLWVCSTSNALGRLVPAIATGMLVWLAILHIGLSNRWFFPGDISGLAFLVVIFTSVGCVGAVLASIPITRRLIWGFSQQQLMLFHGIRVFFGAGFLMFAATGVLPQTFGIIDGLTHISAGFFGLIAAFSLAKGVDGERRAWFANLFGLADILIVASTLALVLLPHIGPHHPMMYAVFLPAPLWLWLHIVSIAKLLQRDVNPVAMKDALMDRE